MADNTPTMNTQPQPKSGGGSMITISAIIIVLLAAGAGYYLYSQNMSGDDQGDSMMNDGSVPDPVAVVNGEEISRADYEESYAQYEAAFAQFGGEVNTEQIKAQVMENLVNSALVRQQAEANGFSTSDEAVQTEIETLIQNFGGQEGFEQQLQDSNLTEAELRAQIKQQLTLNSYVAQEAGFSSIAVTDTEINEFYATLGEGEGVPPLEEIREQLRQQLASQKQQERIATLIANLRAQADIEIRY